MPRTDEVKTAFQVHGIPADLRERILILKAKHHCKNSLELLTLMVDALEKEVGIK